MEGALFSLCLSCIQGIPHCPFPLVPLPQALSFRLVYSQARMAVDVRPMGDSCVRKALLREKGNQRSQPPFCSLELPSIL